MGILISHGPALRSQIMKYKLVLGIIHARNEAANTGQGNPSEAGEDDKQHRVSVEPSAGRVHATIHQSNSSPTPAHQQRRRNPNNRSHPAQEKNKIGKNQIERRKRDKIVGRFRFTRDRGIFWHTKVVSLSKLSQKKAMLKPKMRSERR